MAVKTLVTLDEYLGTTYEGTDREFVEGEVVERSMPTYDHGEMQMHWGVIIHELKRHGLPLRAVSEVRLRVSGERVRVPGFQFMRNTIYVRFCHEDYSKGTALAELGRLSGIARECIFAAGDHLNDLPMLDGTHAKWVACPGNAVEPVKNAVTKAGGFVATGICSYGVVEALRHFGALEG